MEAMYRRIGTPMTVRPTVCTRVADGDAVLSDLITRRLWTTEQNYFGVISQMSPCCVARVK